MAGFPYASEEADWGFNAAGHGATGTDAAVRGRGRGRRSQAPREACRGGQGGGGCARGGRGGGVIQDMRRSLPASTAPLPEWPCVGNWPEDVQLWPATPKPSPTQSPRFEGGAGGGVATAAAPTTVPAAFAGGPAHPTRAALPLATGHRHGDGGGNSGQGRRGNSDGGGSDFAARSWIDSGSERRHGIAGRR